MTRSAVAVATALTLVGCGDQAAEVRNAVNAVQVAATAGSKMEDAAKEAERFQQERVAKGDTLAMPYAELQQYLPAAVEGYTAAGEPSGSSQSAAGFSMSQSEQSWVGPAAADGTMPEVQISLVDFGGTQQGYAMMAAPMMMGFSQEDAHRRVGSVTLDVPYTVGWEEFDKDNKNSKITAVTRYRYVITVEARNQSEERMAMVKGVAEDIARRLDGK
jgi:hypothetical protein